MADRLGLGYLYAVEFIELDLGDVHEQQTHAGEVNLDGFHGAATLSDVAMTSPALIRLERRGNWFGTDRHEPRVGGTIALAAVVNVAGTPVLMVNVHLESHETPQSRADDMRHLLSIVDGLAPAGRAVIGGDFNTSTATPAERYGDPVAWAATLAADPTRLLRPEPHEPLFAVAAEFGYGWTDCNVPDAPTTRYPAGSPRPPAKIDWVFTRGLDVHEAAIIPALRTDGTPSTDHESLLVVVSAR
jgi:endonuclease/exonuclease/phosphatase family metal-dependent hydrolase